MFAASKRAAAAASAPARAGAVLLVADLDCAAATTEDRRGGAGGAEAGRTLCIGLRRLSNVGVGVWQCVLWRGGHAKKLGVSHIDCVTMVCMGEKRVAESETGGSSF